MTLPQALPAAAIWGGMSQLRPRDCHMGQNRLQKGNPMHLALWIVAGVLAAGFIAGAVVKLVTPKDRYAELGHGSQRWAEQFSPGAFKSLGVIELAGGVGLVLPAAVGIAPILVPFAALGMSLYMAGATTTRLLRHEPMSRIAGDLVFVALTVFVVWGRFSAEPFVA